MALKAAKDNTSFFSSLALNVLGESSKAQDYAQAILDANAKVDQALSDANAALTALQEAKKEADKLPAGTANLDTLKTSITAAIKDAKGTDSLAAQVAKVTSTTGKMTAADVAAKVAVIIEKAGTNYIGKTTNFPMNTEGRATVVTYGSRVHSPVSRIATALYCQFNAVKRDDAPAHALTWEVVVGKDKVGGGGGGAISSSGDDGFRRMASFEGMDGGNRETSTTSNLEGIDHTYLGIKGIIYCLEQRCPATNGKPGAGWYWNVRPENRHRHPVRTGSGYEEFTDYAHYGYSLAGGSDTDLATGSNDGGIEAFGLPHDDTESPTRPTTNAAAGLTASTTIPGNNTATYSGGALGISVVTADGKAIKSGQFTADVELTATFATSPTVTGTVKNFKGNAVGNN